MWERAELKANAKKALTRYYWPAVLMCLLYNLLSGTGGSSYASLNLGQTLNSYDLDPQVAHFLQLYMPIIMAVLIAIFVLSIVLSFFLINPLTVGFHRYFMESRTFKSDFSTLFYGFTGGRYWKNVKVLAVRDVKVLLWSFLLLVPGMIKSYEYYMIPYLLAENPNLETDRYFELSKKMTDGEKANIFVLALSFFGWMLLGTLLCGIGTLFVQPYVFATNAELYALMRAKAFALNFSDPTELKDFLPPSPPVYGSNL